MKVAIIIPARNEAQSVGAIVRRCRSLSLSGTTRIVVGDNGSEDRTALEAKRAGAEVVFVPELGYGSACWRSIEFLGTWPEVLVFLDADGSSRPEEIPRLLGPIGAGIADLVVGHRPPKKNMSLPQYWGTRLTTQIIDWRWHHSFRDIGPFRAITVSGFQRIGMRDRTWGWTVEMQLLALFWGLRITEVPVSWDRRTSGESKISGTLEGVFRAGSRILWTLGRYAMKQQDSFLKGQKDGRA